MAQRNEQPDPARRGDARFAYTGLDRLIHERARLSILTSLASHAEGLVFNDLKKLCALTDGNLSRQLQMLSEAGLVEVWKSQHRRRPQTLARLTPSGRRRFSEYLNVLESVLNDAGQVEAESSISPVPRGAAS